MVVRSQCLPRLPGFIPHVAWHANELLYPDCAIIRFGKFISFNFSSSLIFSRGLRISPATSLTWPLNKMVPCVMKEAGPQHILSPWATKWPHFPQVILRWEWVLFKGSRSILLTFNSVCANFQCRRHKSTKLPNPKLTLRYDLTRWIISSHVGSLFKFWQCANWIFKIVTRLASPLRLIIVVRSGWCLDFSRLVHSPWAMAHFSGEGGTRAEWSP